jgi:hypothetical protein
LFGVELLGWDVFARNTVVVRRGLAA